MTGHDHLIAGLIVHNEEHRIGRCISKLIETDKVDKIVIVDQFSTDNTITIAKRFSGAFNLEIVESKFKGYSELSFGEMVKAVWIPWIFSDSNAWLLWIDADEYLDEELVESLDQYIKDKAVGAWNLNRINLINGKPCSVLPVEKGNQMRLTKIKCLLPPNEQPTEIHSPTKGLIKGTAVGHATTGYIVHNKTDKEVQQDLERYSAIGHEPLPHQKELGKSVKSIEK